jgi:hypothetical protein
MVFIPRDPVWLSSLDRDQVKRVQRQLNDFTHHHLKGFAPLIVDGKIGTHTRNRVVSTKFYLGYPDPRSAKVKRTLMRQLEHPNWKIYFGDDNWIKIGARRRQEEIARWLKHQQQTSQLHGTRQYDGKTVAAYFVPILNWARYTGHNGLKWHGVVVSGYRTPAYSEHLCYVMCGAPQCAGRCAGRNTNHAWTEPPRGAVDVSDYVRFGYLMQFCPIKPHIFNALPIDRVHFSPTGH